MLLLSCKQINTQKLPKQIYYRDSGNQGRNLYESNLYIDSIIKKVSYILFGIGWSKEDAKRELSLFYFGSGKFQFQNPLYMFQWCIRQTLCINPSLFWCSLGVEKFEYLCCF